MSSGDETPPMSGIGARLNEVREAVLSGTGYRSPPKDKQFKKGQSGNPKGRPKKEPVAAVPAFLTSYHADVLQEMSKPETLIEKGKKKQLTRQQAVLAAQSALGVKGSALALNSALRMAEGAAKQAAIVAAADKKRAEEAYLFMVKLKVEQQDKWDRFLEDGILPDDPFPRPEDILLDQNKWTFTVRGPWYVDDLPQAVGTRIQRDYAILRLTTTRGDRPAEIQRNGIRYAMYMLLNEQLPLAWQISEDELLSLAIQNARLAPKKIEMEIDILDEMTALLKLPVSRTPSTGSKKNDKLFDQLAKKEGYESFAAAGDALENERKARLTRVIRRAAHERLEAMFKINLAEERERAARMARNAAAMPLYEARRLEVV